MVEIRRGLVRRLQTAAVNVLPRLYRTDGDVFGHRVVAVHFHYGNTQALHTVGSHYITAVSIGLLVIGVVYLN